ncbi:uncharacterized protein LOC133039119 [Cannabis sativa]|uniref:uncharacterized protein LOC133039119 n=1 Tax=Cannabis sativa TaxID=3483 RepID=UPI0029CA5B5C|nr:uncharacterized protein LOC133039119 [Cannabis sativa]
MAPRTRNSMAAASISGHEISTAENTIADVEAPPPLPPTVPPLSHTITGPSSPPSDPPISGVFGSGNVADLTISGTIGPPSEAPITTTTAPAPSSSASFPYTSLPPFSVTTTTPTVHQPSAIFSGTTAVPATTFGQPNLSTSFGQQSTHIPFGPNHAHLGGNTSNLGHGNVSFNDNYLFTANHGLSRAVLDRPSQDERTPLYLGTGDHPNNLIASFLLTGQENFQSWKRAASINIAAKNKTPFIEGTIPRPPPNDHSRSAWDICNNMVMSWILQSVSREIAASIMFKTTASEMWSNLHDRFNQSNGPRILQLKTAVGNVKQGDNSVTTYFTQLQALWDELNEYQPNIPCTCGCTCGAMQKVQDYYTRDQTIQFLIGLNESYWGIRAQILLYEPLPSLSKVFSMVVQQERQRCLGNTGVVAATSAKPNPNQPSRNKKPRPTCSNCLKPGHLVDKCYFLHGFPPGYGDKKKNTTTARANQATVTPTPDPSAAGNSQIQLSQQLISLLNQQIQGAPSTSETLPVVSNVFGSLPDFYDWDS